MTYSYRNHPAHLVCLSVYLYSHKPVFILSWVFPFSLSIHLYISLSFFFLSFHIPCTNFFDFFKNYFMMSDGGGEGEGGGGILFLFLAPTVPLIFSLLNCIYLCFHSSSCPLRSCLSYPSFTPCSLRLLSSLSFTYSLILSIIRISSP